MAALWTPIMESSGQPFLLDEGSHGRHSSQSMRIGARGKLFLVTLVLLVISLVYAIRILLPAIYNRVVVTDEGIDFRQVGYRIRTIWDKLERMTYTQFGFAEGDILVLREPTVEVNRWAALLTKEMRWLEQNKKFAPLGKVIP